MSGSDHDLLGRLEELERQNRRLKRFGGAALGGVAALALVGMAAPRMCETVWAERFVMKDASGKKRLMLDAYATDPTLCFYGKDGRAQAALTVDEAGQARLDLFRGKQKTSAYLQVSEDGNPYWAVARAEGAKTKAATVDENGAVNY